MPFASAALSVVIGHARGDAGALPTLLAHQGGWDEILMVAVPVAIFAVLLKTANKRAARLQQERGEATDSGPDRPHAERNPAEEPRNERRGPI